MTKREEFLDLMRILSKTAKTETGVSLFYSAEAVQQNMDEKFGDQERPKTVEPIFLEKPLDEKYEYIKNAATTSANYCETDEFLHSYLIKSNLHLTASSDQLYWLIYGYNIYKERVKK